MQTYIGVNPELSWGSDAGDRYFADPNTLGQDDNGNIYTVFRNDGTATLIPGQVLIVDPSGNAHPISQTRLSDDAGHTVAICRATVLANELGWGQIFGFVDVRMHGAVQKNDTLYTSGTVGALDDATTGQTRVHFITPTETITGAGTANCFVRFPSGVN